MRALSIITGSEASEDWVLAAIACTGSNARARRAGRSFAATVATRYSSPVMAMYSVHWVRM